MIPVNGAGNGNVTTMNGTLFEGKLCMYIHAGLCTDIVTSTFAVLFSSPSNSPLFYFHRTWPS